MIVVDTNVIAALWIPTPASVISERVLTRDAAWAAPLLWRSELRNVLAEYLRRGLVDLTQASSIAEDAEQHLHGREYQVASHEVLRCARQSGCSAYDCEFVVLASDLRTPLLTHDRAILRAFPKVACRPERFLDPGRGRKTH